VDRRDFLIAAGCAAAGMAGAAEGTRDDAKMPARPFGATGVRVPILGLGTAPLQELPAGEVEAVVEAALAEGITYVDTAPAYGSAQEKLGPVVARRRSSIFLVTKVMEYTKEACLRRLEESLKLLRTDHADLVHLHDIGDWPDPARFESSLEGLEEARRKGMLRFIGASGHNRTERLLPPVRSGRIDAVMAALNFVDRFTYDFEGKVLPAAREKKVAIVAMKVLGGPEGFKYHPPAAARLAGPRLAPAIRYALSLDGVASAVIGVRAASEVREMARIAREFKPLEPRELEALLAEGKAMAAGWGPHFGPVA